jgi:hypothetical protein
MVRVFTPRVNAAVGVTTLPPRTHAGRGISNIASGRISK